MSRSPAIVWRLGAAAVPLAFLLPWGAWAQSERAAKDLERGLELLGEARYQKAISLLERADRELGGASAPALIGLARASNDLGHAETALRYARKALELADDPAGRALAAVELSLALAASQAPDEGELGEALAIVRELLAEQDRSALTDGLRVRLCTARYRLADDSPFAVTTPPADPPRLLGAGEGIRKPAKIYAPTPDARGLRRRRMARTEAATVRAVIDADGCVRSAELVGTPVDPDWGGRVLSTLSEWVFDPARLDGVPVPVFFLTTTTARW